MERIDLLCTLWPSFRHFGRFAYDDRLRGIRLNSAMMNAADLDAELPLIRKTLAAPGAVPLFFDIKGRQPRIAEVGEAKRPGGGANLTLRLTHPIAVHTPLPVLFKAGDDDALLTEVSDGGNLLTFDGFPRFRVKPGESIALRHPSLRILDDVISPAEAEKIAKVREAGITRWFLSYVESERDVDRFLELVGKDAEVWLKIESPKGLEYVSRDFRKRENLRLVAACGDLYVEVSRPHLVPQALRLIVEKDPEACAASRMMLSLMRSPIPAKANLPEDLIRELERRQVPDLADFLQVAWLLDAGYRTLMLCDGLCLMEDKLHKAIGALDAFRADYVPR